MATSVEVAVHASGTSKGRAALAGQWNSMNQQEKTAVVTEALIAGSLAGAAKAKATVPSATATTADVLQAAADRAASTVGDGSGAVYGTNVHTAFKAEVDALENSNLNTEVSYKVWNSGLNSGRRGRRAAGTANCDL